jgi:hypothetical protein
MQALAEEGKLIQSFLHRLKAATGSRFLPLSERQPVALMWLDMDIKFEAKFDTRNVAHKKQFEGDQK